MIIEGVQKNGSNTWDVARLSESVKIRSPAARVVLRFPKILQHPACMVTLSFTEDHSVTFSVFKFVIDDKTTTTNMLIHHGETYLWNGSLSDF